MNILFGVTGGIAAYKAPSIISVLVNKGHNVIVSATKMALEFITQMALATMSKAPVITALQEESTGIVKHIEVCHWCDVFVVAPCTANFLAKMAHGIADDALSTIHLALPSDKAKRICPAMNTHMFKNPVVQRNLGELEKLGYELLPPDSWKLACGDEGIGKLPSTKTVVEFILGDVGYY